MSIHAGFVAFLQTLKMAAKWQLVSIPAAATIRSDCSGPFYPHVTGQTSICHWCPPGCFSLKSADLFGCFNLKMRHEHSRSHSLTKGIQELCERPKAPLTVEQQHRRYARRRRLPDWAWGIVVGLFVSAVVVGSILFGQAR